MERSEVDAMLDTLVDDLATIEHDRWAHWQAYVHARGEHQADGSLVLPPELVRRWQSQIETSFGNLSEAEKESDRDQVRRYLPLIASVLTKLPSRTEE